jgi:hypothetical protein
MQRTVLNRATIEVADTAQVSGRVAADEVNLDRFHNRIRKLCALVTATLILPALAYGQAGNPIAVLQAQVAALQKQVSAQQTQITTLQGQLNAVLSSNVYALNQYVSVDPTQKTG